MITYHRAARALPARRGPTRFSCQRLFLTVLAGTLLLAAGCARKQPLQLAAGQPSPSVRVEQKLDIVEKARSNIGIPYRYGGISPATGFDCSGLVCWSYQQVGIQLPRSARDQIMFGLKVDRQADLKPGDIVVFKGTRGRSGWHSGIYTGNGMFVHSPSTGKHVTESRLDEKYYAQRYAGARRIPRDGSASEMYAQYQAQQKARALVAKESKHPRGRMVAANTKASGKGKTAAGKSDKHAAAKNSKAAKAAPKSGQTVAAAGTAKKSPPNSAGPKTGKSTGKGASKKPDASANKTGKQPAAAPAKPKPAKSTARDGNVHASKNGNAKTPARNKNRS